ncbi:MAG TPA: iron-sulfur cluster assembly accessory protein [Spirochaetia bacterium]|nr:iron-sulfur cluster assembly accessory protein [Spirochaetia bacterium]
MAITISRTAAGKISGILSEQGKAGAVLRVWVAGLGCSGYRYGMGIDEKEPETGDQIFESNGIRVVVDPQSLEYMDGSTVNWVDEQDNSGFAIDNPNPAPARECNCGGGACGCGTDAHAHDEVPEESTVDA